MGDSNDAFMRNRDAAVQARTKAQNRATVLQLKLIGQSHPTGLTTNLLKLFEPRPPLEYKPAPEKRKCPAYTGIAQFVSNFAEPEDPEYAPPVKEGETPVQKRARIHQLRLEKGALQTAEELQKYDPNSDPNTTGDPYKTLFVARLNYETTEHRIKREFEIYGPIKRYSPTSLREEEGSELAHDAYKQADGRKLDNRRVLVDVERGRTVPNWRPRRLGGGLGSTRVGGEEVNQKYSGRESQQAASGSASRSEESRPREDRHHVERDREKSRERGRERDRDRDKEKLRDRDVRDDRHHRDRDRNRDRERERGRDRDRAREKERDRDHDRERERDRGWDRERDRHREKERDYDYDRDHHGHSNRDKEDDFDGGRKSHDHVEPESDQAYDRGYYDHGVDQEQGNGGYGHDHQRRNDHYEHQEDSYQHELNDPEHYDHRMGHEGNNDYRAKGDRSRSRGYDDE